MTKTIALWTLAMVCCSVTETLAKEPMPCVIKEDFSAGAGRWLPGDSNAWKVEETDAGPAYRLFAKSKYKPAVRSPYNISVLKDVKVSDFVLTAKVRSTTPDYGHRDLCLIFGYQDPSHFYYVHFGKKTDNAANQIFIVDGAPRRKISHQTTKGTPWTDDWHTLRVERDVKSGVIKTFFDDMETPVMLAKDKTFAWGQIGIGSFDDKGDFSLIELEGDLVKGAKPTHEKAKEDSHGS